MNNDRTPQGDATSVKSASRVLDVLESLGCQPNGLSFTSLGASLGIPKSSLHALLGILTRRGYLQLNEATGIYTLGIRVWENGQAYLQHHNLIHEARPVMDRIVAEINEVAQLAVLDGIENIYLAKVDCSHPIRLQSDVGKRLFAYATGLGKVLLAHLPPSELDARINGCTFDRFTPNTVTSKPMLSRELAKVRASSFAVDNEEYTPGLRCVAVPIFDHQRQVIAAMSVSIPMIRGGVEQLAAALVLLARGSLEISRHLGCADDDARLKEIVGHPANAPPLIKACVGMSPKSRSR